MSWSEGIMAVIQQSCEEDGIKYRQMDERAIQMGFQGRTFTYQMLALAREEQRQAVFYSVIPLKVQPELRPVVAEYLCRANYGLLLGNFEFDYANGEVRYKTSVDVEGGELTSRMVKKQIAVNLSTVDKYAKGLMDILYRGLTPAEAIAEIEGVGETKRMAAQAAMN
jgi:hypothetical protein